MVVDRVVAGMLAAVGLVVADHDAVDDARPAIRRRALGSSLSHSTPTCHGRCTPAICGVKVCTDTTIGTTPRRRKSASIAAIASWYGSKKQARRVRRSNSLSDALPGMVQPSLSRRKASGSSGLRLQSTISREYPASTAGASSAFEMPRASSPAPMSQAMCCQLGNSGSPRRFMPRGKARLAWSQITSAGASPCSWRTTKGGGSSRPISG